MINLILISHGAFAAGMREAAEMILGAQEKLAVFGLYPGDTVDTFAEKLEQAIDEEVKSLLEELVADTLGRRNDVFLLRSRFANLDEALCRAMEEDGRMARPGAVSFYCLLRMV